MTKCFTFMLGVAAFILFGASVPLKTEAQQEDSMIKVGDEAPDWEMTGSDGKVYKLSDFEGKKGVVVAWYPMAMTGG